MRFLSRSKDGGQNSSVDGFWLVEMKSLFSAALLRFRGKSREVYHSHAFNSISWLVRGSLIEHLLDGTEVRHTPSLRPIITLRSTVHKVDSDGDTVVITFRGSWSEYWWEFQPESEIWSRLEHGRRVVEYLTDREFTDRGVRA